MKKAMAIVITLVSMSTVNAADIAAESGYIPWTFDDFNSNCEVIETTSDQQAAEPSVVTVSSVSALEVADDEDVGELGW